MLGRTTDPSGKTVVTVRLWDPPQVAVAYAESFAEFTRTHPPGIELRTNVVPPYANYFNTLRTDVAGGGADDVFWLNNANFAEYADNHRLMAVEPPLASGIRRWSRSSPAAVHCGGCRS